MNNYFRPGVRDVKLNDSFWTPYTEGIRDIMIPYCFDKFSETGYVANFESVAKKDGAKHIGPPFSDGLVLETITGACLFLAANYDKVVDEQLDKLIDTILSAQEDDGFICTQTFQDYPEKKWGENGGDIIIQHDLYDQGAFVEAATAHYIATGKTKFLKAAVKCANNICSYIGEAPKHNIIPGHSLPELAFLNFADLFDSTPELSAFAAENGVNTDEYREIVRFWYDNRGAFDRGRVPSFDKRFGPEYNQDTMPFANQRKATGHAVRAGLCYAGAALYAKTAKREDYLEALDAIFADIVDRKMHISGGIGARHDIEGFDMEYDLPNNAYLETCAGIALAFFAGEMALIDKNSKYFDIFELSLYNNILGSVGKDFKSYYYDNSLVNDGTRNRWSWHCCPCCPPMLAKIYSTLGTYIYACGENELFVNMYIGSEYENGDAKCIISDDRRKISLDVKSDNLTVNFRVPAYAEDFVIEIDGKVLEGNAVNGYISAVVAKGTHTVTVSYAEKVYEVYANTKASADFGRVAVMKGIFLYCTEGADNGGKTDFVLAENSGCAEKDGKIILKSADGKDIVFIPYFQRNNRVSENTSDSKMAVWQIKYGWTESVTEKIAGDRLYGKKNIG